MSRLKSELLALVIILALLAQPKKRLNLKNLIVLDNYINNRLTEDESLIVGEMRFY